MIKIIKYGVSILSILLLHLYFYDNENTKYIDYKIYDMTTLLLKQQIEREEASHTVIVNIDDKSLEAIGQWPWPRIIEAQLIKKITAMHPSTVATNFLFPEKDRTSPSMLQNFYEQFFNINLNLKALPHAFQDNDKLLTNALKKADGLLSIYFKSNGVMSQHCESLSYRNNIFSNMAHLRSSSSFLCNHQEIQEQMNDFGFINAIEDNDGVVRRVALFRAYKNQIFPSFALATLLKLDKNIEPINSTEFKIINHHIRTDKESRVLLNFQTKAPNIISAIDILNNHIPYSSLQGKIVLLGSTATGLNLSHHTLLYQQISNIELQSTVIDNILNDDLLRQPEFYQKLNLVFSLILSLFILFLLSKKYYGSIFILFFLAIILSFIALILYYVQNIYISIGYFWTPFLHYFFTISLFFTLLNAKEKKSFYKALAESHSAAVESLSLVVAMRHDETGAHIKRTKIYVQLLAEYLHKHKLYPKVLTPSQILYMGEAAPLHDIGKVGIPDEILKKKGRYTPEEYEIMKQHPVLAKEVIEKAMEHYDKNIFLEVAYNIAYYHHERWDGQGYPVGLKGDEIPLEAQLMAIADVYDALVSKRCYKSAFTYEETEELIIEGKGTQFNPIIIDAFIDLRYDFREIAERYKDVPKVSLS